MEKGQSLPDTEILIKLSEIFDVSVDYILCNIQEKIIIEKQPEKQNNNVEHENNETEQTD